MANYNSCKWLKHDDYMTPKYVWEAIRDYIPRDKIIWEAFWGDGKSGQYLTELGFNVIHSPVDFFENNLGDIIVSNPPFSQYVKILKRLKELDKPFILILPSQKLNTKTVRELYSEKLDIIIPRKRIQFIKLVDGEVPTDYKSKCNFDCFYYCYKIDTFGLDSETGRMIWLKDN